jgi:hypothetical protein
MVCVTAVEGKLRDKLISIGLTGGREFSQINLNMNLRKISNHPFLFGEPTDESGRPICDARPDLLITASGKFKVVIFFFIPLYLEFDLMIFHFRFWTKC